MCHGRLYGNRLDDIDIPMKTSSNNSISASVLSFTDLDNSQPITHIQWLLLKIRPCPVGQGYFRHNLMQGSPIDGLYPGYTGSKTSVEMPPKLMPRRLHFLSFSTDTWNAAQCHRIWSITLDLSFLEA